MRHLLVIFGFVVLSGLSGCCCYPTCGSFGSYGYGINSCDVGCSPYAGGNYYGANYGPNLPSPSSYAMNHGMAGPYASSSCSPSACDAVPCGPQYYEAPAYVAPTCVAPTCVAPTTYAVPNCVVPDVYAPAGCVAPMGCAAPINVGCEAPYVSDCAAPMTATYGSCGYDSQIKYFGCVDSKTSIVGGLLHLISGGWALNHNRCTACQPSYAPVNYAHAESFATDYCPTCGPTASAPLPPEWSPADPTRAYSPEPLPAEPAPEPESEPAPVPPATSPADPIPAASLPTIQQMSWQQPSLTPPPPAW